MACPARIYPLRKPKNHRLPIPRWKLSLSNGISSVFTVYIGVQRHSNDKGAALAHSQATSAIQKWLSGTEGPSAFEQFTLIDGCDIEDTSIWVCYWTEAAKYKRGLDALSLPSVYSKLGHGRTSVGIWREAFATEVSRLETNYSGLDYLPGLAKIPGTTTEEHENSAYWGAARDRIPGSAYDLFPRSTDVAPPENTPRGLGQYLVGTNYNNIAHIRSGQFWENCSQDEADAYERKLEPTLHTGLRYLWENAEETGAQGLRYLRNKDDSETYRLRKETCGAGFFTSLDALETWAKTHPSHLAIYRGALSHYKAFGDRRKLRTWHEVSVLRGGDAKFEYLNCVPETGVVRMIPLNIENDQVEGL
ncbi:hypothetical protein FDECE_7888 [Fusarium decemcellulare]|nr:hypothetical protein FDECE_7888 [Fusarium decemcellulare]